MWRLSMGPTTTTVPPAATADHDDADPPRALTIPLLVRDGSNGADGDHDEGSCCRSISTISTADGDERQQPHRGGNGTTGGGSRSRSRCGGLKAVCFRRETGMDCNRQVQRRQHRHSAWLSSALFALLGVGFLLPWNAFLSAADYFRSRLCSSDSDVIRDNFEAIFGFVYNLSAVLSLAVMTVVMTADNNIGGCRRRRKGGAGATALDSGDDQPPNPNHAAGWTLSCTPIRSFHDMLYRKNSWDESSGGGDNDDGFHNDGRGKHRHRHDIDTSPPPSSTESSLSSLPLLRDQYDNPIASAPPPAAFSSAPHRQHQRHHRSSTQGCASKSHDDNNGIGRGGRRRQRKMILYPLLVYLATFSVTALLAVHPHIHPTVFFWYTVVSLILCGASSAFVCAGVLDLASVFSPGIGGGGGGGGGNGGGGGGGGGVGVQSFVSGQGLAGLIVALANLVEVVLRHSASSAGGREEGEGVETDADADADDGSASCPPYETDMVAFASFAVGALVLLVSIGGYLLLDRLPITSFYRERAEFLSSMTAARGRRRSSEESSPERKRQGRLHRRPGGDNDGVVAGYSPPSPERDDDEQPTPPSNSLRERSTAAVIDEELTADARDMELLFHDCFPSGGDLDLDRYCVGGGGVYEDGFSGTQIAASKLAAGRYLARQRRQLEDIASAFGGDHTVNVVSPASYESKNDETTIEEGDVDDGPLLEALLGQKRSVAAASIGRRGDAAAGMVQTPSPPRNNHSPGDDYRGFVLVRQEDAAAVEGGGRGGRPLWSRIRFHALTCFVTFFVTLSLFPSWTYEMTSVRVEERRRSAMPPPVGVGTRFDEFSIALATDGSTPSGHGRDVWVPHNESATGDEDDATDASDYYLPGYLFFPVLFLLFNLFDVVGRMLSSKIVPVRRTLGPNFPLKLLLASLARGVVFYPLFLMCNHRRLDTERQQQRQSAEDEEGRSFLGGWFPVIPTAAVVFDSDWYPAVFMVLFALTNGLLISLALMHAPTVTPRKEQALGATVMTFAMNLGLFLGSMFSFLVLRIGTGEW